MGNASMLSGSNTFSALSAEDGDNASAELSHMSEEEQARLLNYNSDDDDE